MLISVKLKDDLKEAMKAGDKFRKDIIILVRSTFQNETIKKKEPFIKKGITGDELDKVSALTEAEEIAIVKKEVTQTRDAMAEFAKGGREDLVAMSEAKIAMLSAYLPAELTEEEVRALALSVGVEKGMAEGPSIGKVMKAAAGRTNATIVTKVIQEILA